MPHETTPRSGLDEDARLVARTAEGDRAAFTALVSRHQSAVFRFARALTSNDAEAEDVLQQTFLSAFRNAAGFRGEATARTWLFTIARNAAWHARQKLARETPEDEPLSKLGQAAGWGTTEDPEVLATRAEQTECVRRAIDTLGPEDREIVILRDLEGLSGHEVASVLTLSLPAMKSRLHRARLRLMAAIREGGCRGE